jgi:glycosyltransferase involved in cell wall biosynthesis
MRVLHVVPSLSPEWGGPVSVLRLMLPALVNEGVESTILTTKGFRTGQPEAIAGFEYTAYPTSLPAFLWTGLSLPLSREIHKKVSEFDVVHIHELWHYPHFAAARACIKANIPYVITPHGALEPWSVEHKGTKKKIYMSLVQRRLLKKAAKIQALTSAEESYVAAIAPGAATSVIPNGLDLSITDSGSLDQVPPAIQSFLSKYRVITFLSRLHRIKGIEPLVEGFLKASKNIPDAALLFVGPDEDDFTPWITARAKEEGLSDRVMIAGAINGEERFEILRRSWAFALTSYSEGFSMSVLEALACSTPVIISPTCYFPEAIEAGAGLLTEPNAASVATAITEILSNKSDRNAMGTAGRQLIESRYTIQHAARLLAATYEELI